jgi:hypothetical protein
VPPLNYLLVGPANKEILRIVTLRDSAIVIKEEGIYRITGETPQSFTVVPVDLTVYCKAANSVVVLANQVFLLSNQGIVAISESGVKLFSRIEPSLVPLLTNSSLADYTCAMSYESERSYFLSTITQSTDAAANQTFVFNVFTKTWVRHSYAFSSAIVEPGTDKMYFAKASDPIVYIERKSFTDADYADPEYSITISALGTTTIDFTIAGVTPLVGWVITQGSTDLVCTAITALTVGYRATVDATIPSDWTTGAATMFPGVNLDVEWQVWTGNEPEVLKQIYGAAILGDDSQGDNSVTSLDITFRSNFDSEREAVTISESQNGWGSAWGASPWGGGTDTVGYPTYVPRNKQYCTRMTMGVKHSYAKQKLVVAGCSFVFNSAGDRIGR